MLSVGKSKRISSISLLIYCLFIRTRVRIYSTRIYNIYITFLFFLSDAFGSHWVGFLIIKSQTLTQTTHRSTESRSIGSLADNPLLRCLEPCHAVETSCIYIIYVRILYVCTHTFSEALWYDYSGAFLLMLLCISVDKPLIRLTLPMDRGLVLFMNYYHCLTVITSWLCKLCKTSLKCISKWIYIINIHVCVYLRTWGVIVICSGKLRSVII